MPVYIIGEEGNLGTTESEPRILKPSPKAWKTEQALWLASSMVGRWQFGVKRGVVEEFRAYYSNKRVFARVLPEDAKERLAKIDADLEEARRRVEALREERRVFLDAVVVRSEKVRIPARTEAAPEK